MPESRGHEVIVTCFLDENHDGNQKDMTSQTGLLIFINRSTIYWYINQQPLVEEITSGTLFCKMKSLFEMVEAMIYKLRMSGIPIYGPANVYCDDKVTYKNTIIPELTLKNKLHSIYYHWF